MIAANSAEVMWDEQKKNWVVRIQIGDEVIRRACKGSSNRNLADDALQTLAVQTAQDDGYALPPGAISIKR